MVNFSLKEKTALITGASRGIGEAIALTLAENGARCILTSRKIEGLQTVVEKISSAGGQADAFACNVGSLADIGKLFDHVQQTYGVLHILVNNAATNPYFGDMMGADEMAWNKTNDVNIKGPFFMIQHAARLMEKAGGGAIVNVASINGIRPVPRQGIYSITKAGLISMTKAYAKELADRNIRVNALLPGLTETKFSEVLIKTERIYEQAIKGIPLQRHAQPAEMAGAVLYLVSDAASYTTGTTIICDGGALA
ncbi:MAG: SDR family oxidoreductase [Desulfobacterales bacterium]|nr:MAG: SDR family oxidoreductase [Desulfobacterales bacterium]